MSRFGLVKFSQLSLKFYFQTCNMQQWFLSWVSFWGSRQKVYSCTIWSIDTDLAIVLLIYQQQSNISLNTIVFIWEKKATFLVKPRTIIYWLKSPQKYMALASYVCIVLNNYFEYWHKITCPTQNITYTIITTYQNGNAGPHQYSKSCEYI